MVTRVRFSFRSKSFIPLAATLSIVLAWASLGPLVSPVHAERGQWTPISQLYNWGGAVHMALVRGDGNPYHSRVVSWAGGGDVKVFGWQPGVSGCANWPTSSITLLGYANLSANIFCAGATVLWDGSLMTVGGSVGHNWGIRDALTYASGAGSAVGSWTPRSSMSQHRWYGTATPLADNGRVLVSAGLKYEQLWQWGGKRDGAPPASGSGDLLHRFGRVEGGVWDPSVTPLDQGGDRPVTREGHTIAYLADRGGQALFGGRNGAGNLVDEVVWILKREDGAPLAAEYTYRWEKLLLAAGSLLPPRRTEHIAAAISPTEMVVFGGLGKAISGADTVLGDLWRLHKNPFTQQWSWDEVIVNSGTPPSARYGHTAFTVFAALQWKLIIFGGAETPGQQAQDSRVYVFAFDPSSPGSGDWSELELDPASPMPEPRLDHTMVAGDARDASGDAFLYGGRLRGDVLSDTLWTLRWAQNPARWDTLHTIGQSPGARAGHSAAFRGTESGGERGRLFVFGGETPSGALSDRFVYTIDPRDAAQWSRWQECSFHLSQQAACIDSGGAVHARIPEIYSPTTDTWSAQPNAAWLQPETYPVQFVVPGTTIPNGGGRVVTVGQSPQARYLDIPAAGQAAGSWQDVNNGHAGFFPLTGVQYLPGKIMIAGGAVPGAIVGRTKTLDMATTSGWVNRDSMAARYYHNLVILPTGEVLATGGVSSTAEAGGAGVRCPQLWNPSSYTWTDTTNVNTRLACDDVVRNYHSTALILPDGRVMTAGGNATPHATEARIFCPPYLFNSDGSLASRPEISGVVERIRYGNDSLSICMPGPKTLSRVCLIRPAAVTHAFDQNQRYVPLTVKRYASDSLRVIVSVPPDSFTAPPGDYLLFLVDGKGVPSIARWVRVGSVWNSGDVTRPAIIGDLEAEFVAPTAIGLTWTAPGDDSTSGVAWRHDLRYSLSPITSSNFYSATPASTQPLPACPGDVQSHQVTGLQACKMYYFAIRTADESGNLSLVGTLNGVQTLCGGGGGGLAAHEVREESAPSGAAGVRDASASRLEREPVAAGVIGAAGSGPMVAQYERFGEGARWVLYRGDVAAVGEGVQPERIAVQESDEAGGWRTRAEWEELVGGLGLRALTGPGRVVFPAAYELQTIEAHPPGFTLVAAHHSRLGDLGAGTLAAATGDPLAAGDTLRLEYAVAATDGGPSEDCFFVLGRAVWPGELGGRRATPPDRPQVRPPEFAFHQNEPNPFASTTRIRFSLPTAARVKLEVFDLTGRRVRTLANTLYPPGEHQVLWDRRTSDGKLAEPGLYFCRIEAAQYHETGRMVILP